MLNPSPMFGQVHPKAASRWRFAAALQSFTYHLKGFRSALRHGLRWYVAVRATTHVEHRDAVANPDAERVGPGAETRFWFKRRAASESLGNRVYGVVNHSLVERK